MRVGGEEGMQHFDGEIERMIRAGVIDMDTGMAYATNPGNLRLELADFAEDARALAAQTAAKDGLLETTSA
jgi:twitching motility protein PilT